MEIDVLDYLDFDDLNIEIESERQQEERLEREEFISLLIDSYYI